MDVMSIIMAIAGLVIGVFLGRFLLQGLWKGEKEKAEKEALTIINEAKERAETIKKEKIVEAKERQLQIKQEFEQKAEGRKQKILDKEQELKKRDGDLRSKEGQLNKKDNEIKSIKENLDRQVELVGLKKEQLEQAYDEHIKQLEQVSGLSAQDAKAEMIEALTQEAKTDALAKIKEIRDEAKLKASKEAKKIVIQTIQRTAAEQTIENSVSVFNLESDDIKGQIIGREGRNIRALEAATGVELIVDDTPETVLISGFDAVRREVARLSLTRLVADGRIHPSRIEEVVAKTRKEIEEHIMEIGERTVIDMGIHGLHAELVRYVGRMRFRSSYGQNLLQHSRETANLCATMAAELGLNAKLAKRAGLLHDIGKVPEDEPELSHALLGAKLAEKYGEHPAVVNAIGAHHDEMEMQYAISPIIQACDAISGARPGARRETMENYIQRLKDLEKIALTHEGVNKAYAVHAGRELRIIVESEKVTIQMLRQFP